MIIDYLPLEYRQQIIDRLLAGEAQMRPDERTSWHGKPAATDAATDAATSAASIATTLSYTH